MNLDIKNIKILENETFILSLLDLLFLILPGVAFIYIFNNQLFQGIDWIKLILISGAVTTPLVLVNTFVFIAFDSSKKKDNTLFLSFSLSLIVSGLLLYGVIAINYFLDRPFGQCAFFVLFIEVALLLSAFIHTKRPKK